MKAEELPAVKDWSGFVFKVVLLLVISYVNAKGEKKGDL